MQEEQSGISVGEIFKTIAVCKWLAIIIAAVIAVAGTLALYFGYGRSKSYFEMKFGLLLPGVTAEAVYTYPDNTKMHYTDMISYANLSLANERSGAGVDVAALANNGGISLEREVDEQNNVTYTLTVKTGYFANYESAKKFMTAVADNPVIAVGEMNLDYDSFLSLSVCADDYESQIVLLQSQLTFLQTELGKIVKEYGGNVVVGEKTLSTYYSEIQAYADNNNLDILLAKVKDEAILKDEATKDKYAAKKINLDRQLTVAQNTLDNLMKASQTEASGNQIYVDATVLKQQSDLVENLKLEIADIEKYLSDESRVDKEFETTYINPEYDKIRVFTEQLNTVIVEVYDQSASVAYYNANIVSYEGGMGILTCILISVVAGVVIALVAGYIAGKSKLKKASVTEKPQTDKTTEENS